MTHCTCTGRPNAQNESEGRANLIKLGIRPAPPKPSLSTLRRWGIPKYALVESREDGSASLRELPDGPTRDVPPWQFRRLRFDGRVISEDS